MNYHLDYQQDVEPMMRGQWHGFIAQETGIEPVTEGKGKGRGQPCPVCGGSDRAHFKEKDGRVFLFCRGACGNTNSSWGHNTCSTPEHLCMTVGGYEFGELVGRCADWLGMSRPEPRQYVERKNSPTLTPKVEAKRAPPSHHYEKRQTPVNAILERSEVVPWNRIGYCMKNALSGAEGEFLAAANDAGGYDLLVPLFLEASGRVVMTGVVQVMPDGKAIKHGSCDGAFATITHSECDGIKSVFATDISAAETLSRRMKCKAFYSPSPNAFVKCGANHVYLNTGDIDAIDRANGLYKREPMYIIPAGEFSRDHAIQSFEFLTYDECQARVLESENMESQHE